jgi:predicted transcriptional regulator
MKIISNYIGQNKVGISSLIKGINELHQAHKTDEIFIYLRDN